MLAKRPKIYAGACPCFLSALGQKLLALLLTQFTPDHVRQHASEIILAQQPIPI